jgi:hypothetical protein
MEMKFGSDTPSSKSEGDQSVSKPSPSHSDSTGRIQNYTFDRKNYKTYKKKEIISGTSSDYLCLCWD